MESIGEFVRQAQSIRLSFEDKAKIKQALEVYMLTGQGELAHSGIFSRFFSRRMAFAAPLLKYGIINGIWKNFRKGS